MRSLANSVTHAPEGMNSDYRSARRERDLHGASGRAEKVATDTIRNMPDFDSPTGAELTGLDRALRSGRLRGSEVWRDCESCREKSLGRSDARLLSPRCRVAARRATGKGH